MAEEANMRVTMITNCGGKISSAMFVDEATYLECIAVSIRS